MNLEKRGALKHKSKKKLDVGARGHKEEWSSEGQVAEILARHGHPRNDGHRKMV